MAEFMVGDASPHEIQNALLLLGEDWITLEQRRSLPVHALLAEAWRPDRLERCRALLAEGRKPPPIRVVGLKIGRRTLYSISDGIGRSRLAKRGVVPSQQT